QVVLDQVEAEGALGQRAGAELPDEVMPHIGQPVRLVRRTQAAEQTVLGGKILEAHQSRSSSQAIWIASRIFSLDLFGSSSKSGSCCTHFHRSVKRIAMMSTS